MEEKLSEICDPPHIFKIMNWSMFCCCFSSSFGIMIFQSCSFSHSLLHACDDEKKKKKKTPCYLEILLIFKCYFAFRIHPCLSTGDKINLFIPFIALSSNQLIQQTSICIALAPNSSSPFFRWYLTNTSCRIKDWLNITPPLLL